jgi:uncharacterized SAM-dependent methyltransferase
VGGTGAAMTDQHHMASWASELIATHVQFITSKIDALSARLDALEQRMTFAENHSIDAEIALKYQIDATNLWRGHYERALAKKPSP